MCIFKTKVTGLLTMPMIFPVMSLGPAHNIGHELLPIFITASISFPVRDLLKLLFKWPLSCSDFDRSHASRAFPILLKVCNLGFFIC